MHYLQAYYYTQESMEAFRNMRDTHFMHNLDFCGKDGVSELFELDGSFKDGCDADEDGVNYSVALNTNLVGQGAWKLALAPDGVAPVYLQKDSAGPADPTAFNRICNVSDGGADYPDYEGMVAIVTCRTTWEEYSKEREVSLSMILTDWHSE